ncbi:MAG: Hint domain-containing protein [Pseudomonadota bacterium]
MVPAAELTYNTSATALEMANVIFGAGATVEDATYSGWNQSSAIYSNGDALSDFATPADTGVILSTGRASDFTNASGQANQRTNTTTNTPGADNDALFNAAAGTSTFDASILTVDFIPDTDKLSIQFTYSSEEYPEFVNSIFNDLVGVWVNGNYVELAVGTGDSNIGNINAGSNQNLFVDNSADDHNTEMDGFTVSLTLTLNVIPDIVNTIRIGVADVADPNFDSNLLIAADSIQNEVLLGDDEFDIKQDGTRIIDVLENDLEETGGTLTITHINGQSVVAGDTVTLSTGQEVTLNADGTFTVKTDDDIDSINFTYQAENDDGVDDVAFVTINTIPCFVAGTRIMTPDGERRVETLIPGDMVETYDNGMQPIRWVGTRTVTADGQIAPIRIAPGALGAHRALTVSPQHRVLVRDQAAQLYFGQSEVLVTAKDLVNGLTVSRLADGSSVTYIHILFDEHQLVYSEGLLSESFLPGPQTMQGFPPETVAEICKLFPELDPETGAGYGPASRRSLKAFETLLLLDQARAA